MSQSGTPRSAHQAPQPNSHTPVDSAAVTSNNNGNNSKSNINSNGSGNGNSNSNGNGNGNGSGSGGGSGNGGANSQIKATITDSTATNSRQLLNAYIYDFLIKSGLSSTAKAFYQEAEIPTTANNLSSIKRNNSLDNDLPPLAMSMDAPQGFLYEWWQIFWDVFNARTHRGGSAAAQQYYNLHLLKQRQEHSFHGMSAQAMQGQAMFAQQQAQQQHQQQQQHHQQAQAQPQAQQQLAFQQQHMIGSQQQA
ncbi:hypothetical protein PACTADRAFT_68511, partial [Pachysolen tannophilus NRRL Y-2460]